MDRLQFFKIICVGACFWGLSSCHKHYVSVTRLDINKASLASVFAKSPDPRLKAPPKGEQLIIEWNLPSTEEHKKLLLDLSMIYHNHTSEVIQYALDDTRGLISYFLLGEDYQTKKGILTCKAEIKTPDGKVIKSWQEKLWVRLIQLDEEEELERHIIP